jgi:hypothetical protein
VQLNVKIGMFLGSSSIQLAELAVFQEIDFLLSTLSMDSSTTLTSPAWAMIVRSEPDQV